MPTRSSRGLSRRRLLQGAAGAGLAALTTRALAPQAFATGPYPSDGPELSKVSIGFVAVQSCAPLIVAHERKLFAKHGLESTLVKEASWAAARDKLASGENHATHMKMAQPIGGTMGVLGAMPTPMIAPFTLARGGSAFLIAKPLAGRLTKDPETWKAVAAEYAERKESFTIALPLFQGWHGMMYRHFLANAGIDADRTFKVITLPPAQMVQNMKVGTMQACAMVEPWGVRGVATKIANVVMYGHELWPSHPIKSLGLMADFAQRHPLTVRAILRAVHEAAVWCDDLGNRAELARMLAVPSYLHVPEDQLLATLNGRFDWGDGRTAEEQQNAITYSVGTYPQRREFKWLMAQFSRWGMVEGTVDYDRIATNVMRCDLYDDALRDLGVAAGVQDDTPIALWDGTRFDHTRAAEHVLEYAVHNRKL